VAAEARGLIEAGFPGEARPRERLLKGVPDWCSGRALGLKWLRVVELSVSDYLRLVDYGFLRRSPHPAGVTVSLTEKALRVLSLGEG